MIPGSRLTESLYFFGLIVLLFIGIGLKSTAAIGLGILLIYTGRKRVQSSGETSEALPMKFLKNNLIWDLIFLAISVLILFSVTKFILKIFLHEEIIIPDQWILPVSGLGLLYFEFLFRLTGDKKNRIAVLLLIVLLVISAASIILGGIWHKIDLFLGFLSLAVTVIISFNKAYVELSDLLSG